MQLFYSPGIISEYYRLTPEESTHCIRVLRKKRGDTIQLTDGRGNLYTAELLDDSPKGCEVKVIHIEKEYGKRPYTLHLAVAPTKNIDRYEWLLEKATEIGVDIITPLECEHSERRTVKKERSEKVITSAVKQSLKAYHPICEELTPFHSFISREWKDAQLFIAHCEKEADKILLSRAARPNGNYVVLIGPEGDFSLQEIEEAHRRGFKDISLGESRLRTETAGVMATAMLYILNSI